MSNYQGEVIGLARYQRKIQAIEKNLPQLCPKCIKIVDDALKTK